MIKRKAVVAATVTAAAALITLTACTWMPMAYASETTADEATETYHVYTVSITVDGKTYNDVTCDDTRTIWDFVNEIGINDMNDTNITLRDENDDEINRDTLMKELDGAVITTEAVDNKPQVPTEQTYSITLNGETYESTDGDQTVWEFLTSKAGVTEDGNTTITIRDENDDEVSRDTLLKDVSGQTLTLEAKSFYIPKPDNENEAESQNTAESSNENVSETAIDTNSNETKAEHVFFILDGDMTIPNKITFTEGETYRDALIEGTYPEQRMFERYVFKDPTTGEEFDMNQQAKDGVTIQYKRLARATYILNATPDGKAEKFFIEMDGMEAYDTAKDTSDGDLQLPTLTDPSGEYVCVGIEPIMDSVENPAFLSNQTAYIEQHYPDGVPNTEGQQIAENSVIETAKAWKAWADPVENGGIYTYGNGKIGYYGEVKIWISVKSRNPVGIFRAVWEKKSQTPEKPQTPQETPKTPEKTTTEETPKTPEKPQQETVETVKNAPKTTEEETEETPKREIVQTGIDNVMWAAITAEVATVAGAATLILKTIAKRHL